MIRKPKRLCAVFLLIVGMIPWSASAANGTHRAPKLLNLFLDWQIQDEDPAKLARWDIVVLDVDQQFSSPEKLREIRRLNPHVKLLAYIGAGEISEAKARENPAAPGYALASSVPEAWFLHRSDGTRLTWWPGSHPLNATDACPMVNGYRWNTFLGPWIRDQVMSSGLWDGVFLDSAYAGVAPVFGANIDVNNDGMADASRDVDNAWRGGMEKLIRNVRASIGNDKLILNNSSAAYAHVSNGVLFENFPRYGWAWPFAELRSSLARNPPPKISAVNTNTNNRETPWDYRLMRYGLTSALVADAYYSFDAGDRGHHRTWWYDEYAAVLGSPRLPARMVRGSLRGNAPAVWSRAYANGVVLVNGTRETQEVSLDGAYERLRGTQDPAVNTGAIETRVRIPAEDGIVLLRRADAMRIRHAAFINGTFYEVFEGSGRKTKNGFFAMRDDAPGGSRVLLADVDRDGLDDLVFAIDGRVTIRFGNGFARIFFPFGRQYRGDIELAAGQTDRDEPWELILAPSSGARATVLVTDMAGRLKRSWTAYMPQFQGGATVAVGDLDGDDRREVITGPGRSGGPHIRFFKTDGSAWSGGFFAFDPSENGGANVALGDLDGDGRDELVVGSGSGTPARVRVYDISRNMRFEMFLDARPSPVGVRPVVADIDGDGKAELLIPGRS